MYTIDIFIHITFIRYNECLDQSWAWQEKLVFFKDGNHQQFVEKINKDYPRLVQCGGFILHRAATGGYGRLLTSLNAQWFHVKLLRRKKVSGHGVVYIKPMQQNLSLDPVTEEEVFYLNILCIL